MQILIMSDIHGNEQALWAALARAEAGYQVEACVLLGDVIDYGMHSNEVIQMLKKLPYPLLCNLWGNHEAAIASNQYECFSSARGQESARYTRNILTDESWAYIQGKMSRRGIQEFSMDGKQCLAVHGSFSDEYWGKIGEGDEAAYQKYDYVFSGHSHRPHLIERYYPEKGAKTRGEKKVVFINPGSVGQPRNHNPAAQFVILEMETEQVVFEKVVYDVRKEQAAYSGQVDLFYKERLGMGI